MSRAVIVRPLPMTVLLGTDTLTGYDATNITNDYLGVVWKAQGASHAAQTLVVDLGADLPIDTIALLGLTGAQSNWTLDIAAATQAQGAFTGSSYSYPQVSLLAGSASTASGRGRSYWEAPAGGPAAARYWRIIITTPANNTAVTVGRLVIGTRFRPERNFDFGAAFGTRDQGKVDWSARGVLLRRRGVKLRSVGLSFNALYKDEVEATVKPIVDMVGNTGPILLVTDTDAHAQRQNRIYFGPMVGDLGTVWAKANAGFQWQANVVDLEQITGAA